MLLEAFDTVENQVLSPMAFFVFVLRWGGALGGGGLRSVEGQVLYVLNRFRARAGGGRGRSSQFGKPGFGPGGPSLGLCVG